MRSQHVIFVSAVSAEFHRCPPEQRHLFQSYRDVLKAGFRMLAPHYEVIVQEDLVQGIGDLLETLDLEVARSLVIIHLVGDLAGWKPEPACLRELHARHGEGFLAAAPELRSALGDEADISYTQWEAYLAFHHGKPRLIFEAQPGVPRSPLFVVDEKERASQERHRARLRATGAHRGPFENQGDVARKTMRSFLHFRLDPGVDAFEPTQDALDEAWAHQEAIVQELAAAIKKPDPRAVPVTDPANVAAFVAAVRAGAEKWHVNLTTIVAIAARHEEQVRAAVEDHPAPETLYAQAFAELALGDFTAARHTARRAADLAMQFRQQQPEDADRHREAAVNALLLLHDAANGAHDPAAAIAALEEAGALIDKERDPLLWAEVHEPLATFLLDHARYDRADDLISDILDIREQRQGENHRDVAKTLVLWTELLHAKANFQGMESVAARAGRIYAAQVPPDLPGISTALNNQAQALDAQGRLAEAEPLMRRALAIDEASFGPEHPEVATHLSNLAQLLKATNRSAEAEPLMRRALAMGETTLAPSIPRPRSTSTTSRNCSKPPTGWRRPSR
jgi:tetratricopeptide (TPR) repeat protein